jgi:hypothetical protein
MTPLWEIAIKTARGKLEGIGGVAAETMAEALKKARASIAFTPWKELHARLWLVAQT